MVFETKKPLGSGSREAPNLAVWLEERCRTERLSYRQAAAKTRVSHATIAAIKNGNRPSAATLVKLAAAFGGNGQHQRMAVEDTLLGLCGYRSKKSEVDVSEPLGRLLDKVSNFDELQIKVIEQFVDFVAKVGGRSRT